MARKLFALALFACAMWWSVSGVAQPALRPDMVRSLETMQQRLSEGATKAVANQALQAAERLKGGNTADRWARALFLQLAASAEARQGRDAQAADLLAEARGIDGIEASQRLKWLSQEARLRLRAGQLERGGVLLGQWLERAQGSSEDYWLMAQTLANQQRWEQAASWVERARRKSQSLSADQLSLAASVYQQAGQDAAALEMLNTLLAQKNAEAAAWKRAAGLAQRLGKPGRAAAIWEAAWRRGILTSDEDLLQLIRLHLAGGTPARAAEHLEAALQQGRLERNLDNLRLLAESWTAARDHAKSLRAWRNVAERSGRGEDWQKLGELAYGWGRWREAVEALGRARAAGVSDPRNWLLEGVSHLELGERDAARAAFEAALRAGSSRAEAWLSVIDAKTEVPATSSHPAAEAGRG